MKAVHAMVAGGNGWPNGECLAANGQNQQKKCRVLSHVCFTVGAYCKPIREKSKPKNRYFSLLWAPDRERLLVTSGYCVFRTPIHIAAKMPDCGVGEQKKMSFYFQSEGYGVAGNAAFDAGLQLLLTAKKWQTFAVTLRKVSRVTGGEAAAFSCQPLALSFLKSKAGAMSGEL